ncbi:MAG TPA: hypothetical protein VJU82_09855 [Acidobacteriaceae bacterium]|nr:hypothetical protein [Acidobacteriaceae bacterium]
MTALYSSAVIVGLFSLAASIVMAATVRQDIYDALWAHPATFTAYTLVRVYQYLLCYPTILVVPVGLAALFFRSLAVGDVRFNPFAADQLGGLRDDLRAVDRPIYLIQLLATIIVITNYVGWGGLSVVPAALGLGAVAAVTAIGVLLHASFSSMVRKLRAREVQKIRDQQALLYEQIRSSGEPGTSNTRGLVDEIEAGDRLVQMICRRKSRGWPKYLVNLLIAVVPSLFKLATGDSLTINGELAAKLLKNLIS